MKHLPTPKNLITALALLVMACATTAVHAQDPILARPATPGYAFDENAPEIRSMDLGLFAYPNPFNEFLNIQATGCMGKPIIVELRAVPGGSVLQQQTLTYTGTFAMNTVDLPIGWYILTVRTTHGQHIGSREVRKAFVR